MRAGRPGPDAAPVRHGDGRLAHWGCGSVARRGHLAEWTLTATGPNGGAPLVVGNGRAGRVPLATADGAVGGGARALPRLSFLLVLGQRAPSESAAVALAGSWGPLVR